MGFAKRPLLPPCEDVLFGERSQGPSEHSRWGEVKQPSASAMSLCFLKLF